MTQAIFSLSATHWWTVLGWTIWSYFWIGLAEFLLVLPFYLLLRRRSPEVRYNVLLLWMALLCMTPLFLLARVNHALPAPLRPVVSESTVPAVAVVPPGTIRPEPPDSIPNVIPPDRTLDSIPTLIVPDQAISRMPGANRPRNGNAPTGPFAPIQILSLSPGGSASTVDQVISPWIAALIPWLPLLWMLGGVFSFLLIGFGLVGAERFRRQATILTSGPLYDRCAVLATRLQIRGKVLVALCDRIATPILLGIWRPLILLPLAAETGWPPDQLDMILLHELAHVRRFDNFVHLLQRLAEGLLFFQPAVWILSRWISLEREHCCDSLVVRATGRPQDYARTLAQLALGEPFPSNLAPLSAMAQSHLLTRIRRILNQEQPLQVSRGTLGIASACLFLALLIVGALNAREISLPAAQEEAAANQKLTDQQSAAKQSEPIKVPVPEATLPTVWIQVVDVANVPIPGVQVEMLDSKRQSILQSQSDEKGWIAIPVAEVHRLTLKKEGYLTIKMSDVLRKFPQRFVTQQIPGQRPSLVKVSLATMTVEMMGCGTLVARVLGPDGKPAPHVPVELANYFSTNLLDRNFKRVFSVSDAHGVAIFRNLREGLLSISYPAADPSSLGRNVLADLTPQQRADGAAWIDSQKLPYPGLRWSQTLFLQDADMPGLTIDLSECKSSLSGQVIDSKGQPLPDLLVCLNHVSTPDREDIDPLAYDRLMRKFVERKHPDISSYFKDGTIVDVNGASLKSDREGKFNFSGIRQGKSKLSVYRRVPTTTGPFAGVFDREVLVKEEYLTLEPNKPLTDLKITLPDLPEAPPSVPVPRKPLPQDSLDIDAQQKIDKPGFKTVTARVVDSKGKPVPSVRVVISWEEKKDAKLEGNAPFVNRERLMEVDSNGVFSFSAQTDLKYKVGIFAPGYVLSRAPLDLARDEEAGPETFTLIRLAKIIARVKGPDGKLIPNRRLSTWFSVGIDEGLGTHSGVRVLSSQEGAFEREVVPGDVTLSYTAGGETRVGKLRYNTSWKVYLENTFWAEFLTLREGETRELDIDFSVCTGKIRRRVLDQNNQPVVGKILDLLYLPPPATNGKTGSWNPVPYPGAITNSEGRYEIIGLRPGTYKIWASEPYTNNRNSISPTVTVEVTGDKVVECDLKANAPISSDKPKKLSVTILGPDKKPLPNALVFVTGKATKVSSERYQLCLADRQGVIETPFATDQIVTFCYPIDSAIPASVTYRLDKANREASSGGTRYSIFDGGLKDLEMQTPVKGVIWMGRYSGASDPIRSPVIDLSQCNSRVEFQFVEEQGAPAFPQYLSFWKAADPAEKPRSPQYPFRLKTDDSGRLSLGKLNPGTYYLFWSRFDGSIRRIETFTVENGVDLKQKIVLPPNPAAGQVPSPKKN